MGKVYPSKKFGDITIVFKDDHVFIGRDINGNYYPYASDGVPLDNSETSHNHGLRLNTPPRTLEEVAGDMMKWINDNAEDYGLECPKLLGFLKEYEALKGGSDGNHK